MPYVPQSEALCGGAAAAMVLRYWREQQVYAEDFASLVEPIREGIRTDALVDAIRRRGWTALPLRGTADDLRSQLAKGRPLVALIEDRPGRYHYVVVVGLTDARLVLHDPARTPYRVLDLSDFDAAWSATERWMLLILPPDPATRTAESAVAGDGLAADRLAIEPDLTPRDECSPQVDEAVDLARGGNLVRAETVLSSAMARCPASAGAVRELAGVRFLQSRWAEAEHLAARTVALAPEDTRAWRLLATTRFLQDDLEGALEAWNQNGEPRVDLTRIEGLRRTRYAIVTEWLGLMPRTLLTEQKLRRARRRVAELPVEIASRVGYRPRQSGWADIEVALVERPLMYGGRLDLAASAVRAASDREISVNVASPDGAGELWNASWRWWHERPRVSLSLASPRLWRLKGLWRAEGSWEQQGYSLGTDPAGETSRVMREERRRASLTYSDWILADLRWRLGAALDRWEGRGNHLALESEIETRQAGDLLAFDVSAGAWSALDGRRTFGQAAVSSAWRSSTELQGPLFLGRAGLQGSTRNAPLDLWAGAGAGHGRAPLLRAHSLLDNGIIAGKVFGRSLAYGGIEFQQWRLTSKPFRLGFAAFTDVAKAWNGLDGSSTSAQVDLGAGLRLAIAGQPGTLRVDAARGLRDGSFAISVGWQPRWPTLIPNP